MKIEIYGGHLDKEVLTLKTILDIYKLKYTIHSKFNNSKNIKILTEKFILSRDFQLGKTMLPGTTREILIPILEKAATKKEGKDLFVAYNPWFLRESSAVYDFNNPPKTVVGASSKVADKILELYSALPDPMIKTEIEVAEMVKYVDNAFHAVKITFANEV